VGRHKATNSNWESGYFFASGKNTLLLFFHSFMGLQES
jgi:hypothetical protein